MLTIQRLSNEHNFEKVEAINPSLDANTAPLQKQKLLLEAENLPHAPFKHQTQCGNQMLHKELNRCTNLSCKKQCSSKILAEAQLKNPAKRTIN